MHLSLSPSLFPMERLHARSNKKPLQLKDIKVWLTFYGEDGIKLPIANVEINEKEGRAGCTVYFERRRQCFQRFSIIIQTDLSRRMCEVWTMRPAGRGLRRILKRCLDPCADICERKGTKALYCLDAKRGQNLISGVKISRGTSMETFLVKVVEGRDSYKFTFKLQVAQKMDDDGSSSSESQRDDGSKYAQTSSTPLDISRSNVNAKSNLNQRDSLHTPGLSGAQYNLTRDISRIGSLPRYTSVDFDEIKKEEENEPSGIRERRGFRSRGATISGLPKKRDREELCALLENCKADILAEFDLLLSNEA